MKKYKTFLLIALISLFSLGAHADNLFGKKLARQAEKQIGVTTSYNPAYLKIAYPGGDVPQNSGVCSDVIIRAYRTQSIDLQKKIHEDMSKYFAHYPTRWGLKKTDTNIDHRRVENLQTFFKRYGEILPNDKAFLPGDIVVWNLKEKGSQPHIGIVAEEKTSDGTPLIIHNINSGTKKENSLFAYRIVGHYRYGK